MGSCNPSGSVCISCRNLVFFDQKSTQTERHRTNFRKKKITPGLSFPPSSNFNKPRLFQLEKDPRHLNQNPISSHFNSPWLRPLQRTRCFSLWKRHVGEVLHATFPPWNLRFSARWNPPEKTGGRSYTRRVAALIRLRESNHSFRKNPTFQVIQ